MCDIVSQAPLVPRPVQPPHPCIGDRIDAQVEECWPSFLRVNLSADATSTYCMGAQSTIRRETGGCSRTNLVLEKDPAAKQPGHTEALD